ncbi:MAG: TIR domain-containing protein [Cyclobacteriaceae bacterium]
MTDSFEQDVFLSYCRDNIAEAQQIQQQLQSQGITVWRDQESIYGGQQWPKIIGESIAVRKLFVLLWSEAAANSHFVEFEWNTALALKKIIIPILLDDTPLPSALSSFQALKFPLTEESLSLILSSKALSLSNSDKQESVIRELKSIPKEPEKAIESAKAIYQQDKWVVHGDVIQNFGNNNTDTNKASVSNSSVSKSDKKWYERWQSVVALLVGIISIPSLLLDLPKKIREEFANEGNKNLTVKGLVSTMDNKPIAGANVRLDLLPDTTFTTTSNGGFIFNNVPGQVGEKVRVYVLADGYKPADKYYPLPGPIPIKMEPLPKKENTSFSK